MKNQFKLMTIVAAVALTTGCASTTMSPQSTPKISNPNDLVGMSVAEQLEKTKKELNDQIFLLQAIKQGEQIDNYNLVTHNNNVDARVGSENTVPLNYAQQGIPVSNAGHIVSPEVDVQVKVDENVTVNEEVLTVKTTGMEQGVKRIIWNNDSLNTLAENFAGAVGYELVIKGNKQGKDNAKVNFFVENVTMGKALSELKTQVSDVANILVVDQNKTINVLYK